MARLPYRWGPVRDALPGASLARWASLFFSLSVLTILLKLAASQFFLALAGVAYAAHLLRGRTPHRFPPIKLPLMLFCLLTLVSVFFAEDRALAWLAVQKLTLFVIVLLAVSLVASSRQLAWLTLGLFLESALGGLVAAGQFVLQYRSVSREHPDQVYFYMTADRVRGFMGHWMHFGGQQMMVFLVLAALLLATRQALSKPGEAADAPRESKPIDPLLLPAVSRWVLWLLIAVVAGSIVLNFTRGAWLGCVVGLTYLVSRWKPRWLWALPVLLVAGYFAAPSMVRRRISVLRHPATDASLSIRLEMWRVGLRMIETHPFVGVGPNSIEKVYQRYLPPGEEAIAGYHEHLHNDFLQFGAERGLPCLAAWMWLMGALAWGAVGVRRRLARDQGPVWIVDAALAVWLAFVVEGCFEFNFGTSPVLMLFLYVASTPFLPWPLENRP